MQQLVLTLFVRREVLIVDLFKINVQYLLCSHKQIVHVCLRILTYAFHDKRFRVMMILYLFVKVVIRAIEIFLTLKFPAFDLHD